MKKFFMDLFDETSNISSMRFMSVTSLFIGAGIAIYGIAKVADLTGVALLVSVFVGAAFTGKVMQKNAELKSESETTETIDAPTGDK